MENLDNLEEKQKKKIMMIAAGGAVLLLFGIIAVVFWFLGGGNGDGVVEYEPEVDPISGEVIWNIDEEPEVEQSLTMIGFSKVSDLGFMHAQYNKIVKTIEEYIEENYPECLEAKYWEGTFEYLNAERTVSAFNFVLDGVGTFRATLDTEDSLTNIKVSISQVE